MFARRRFSSALFWCILLVSLVRLLAFTVLDEEQILALVRKAMEGDENAFATLYQLYYQPILRYLYRIVGNEADAYDLMALTFTKVWYKLSGIKDERSFLKWLYKIATNTARDFLRSRKARKGSFFEPLHEDYELGQRFENGIEEQELIKQALEQVDPKPRACLILYMEGFSPKEIAEYLGMKEASVITYISIARKQFREAYRRFKQ